MLPSLRYLSILLVLVAGSITAQEPTTYQVSQSVTGCTNVRRSANTQSTVIACIPAGTQVTVDKTAPYWFRIILPDGRRGWAAKKFFEVVAIAPPSTTAVIPDSAWLTIHFVDVGQGDGIWISTFDDGKANNGVFEGRNVIIDGGPDASDSRNALLKYLRDNGAYDGAIIDALIITHPHNDHYPGARGILRNFSVKSYYDPGYPKDGPDYQDFLSQARANSEHAYVGRSQFRPIDLGHEAKLEFLYSYSPGTSGLGSGNTLENNASIVIKLTYGRHTFLFMGDAEGKERRDSPDEAHFVEKILLDSLGDSVLKATVLKSGHHGSESSSTLPFLRAVRPEVIVISSGRKAFNGTYIPDSSSVARYCALSNHPSVYRTDYRDAAEGRTTTTDTDGDHVVIRTNGRELKVEAYSAGKKTPGQRNACM